MEKLGNLLSPPLRVTQDAESQPYSTGVPTEWISAAEAVFEQLAIHYGAARMSAHWNGVNPEKAKLHWARSLMKLERRGVGFALQHLPDMPPSIDEFCAIARRVPRKPFVAIQHKDSEEELEHRRKRLEAIKAQFKMKSENNYEIL